MKKFLKGLLMGVVCSSLVTYVINEKLTSHIVYCECCGELFHNEYTINDFLPLITSNKLTLFK